MPNDDGTTLPHSGWFPRPHQLDLWRYLWNGGLRASEIWHRRSGKDDVCLHWAAVAAHQRVATYWHMLPEFTQGRKAIWTAVNPQTGKRRIDEAFPHELRANTNDQEMFIRFKCGSTWQVVGSDRFDAAVGSPPAGITFSEWALSNPAAWAYLAPILVENGGWAIFITTSRGRNHAKTMHDMARTTASWHAQIVTVEESGFPKHLVEAQRSEYHAIFGEDAGDALIEQEYFCSFEAAVLGSYWGKELTKAERDGRICTVPINPDLPVHKAWDIGVDDPMAIWCFQVSPGMINVVDYYESSGHGFDHYWEWNKECPNILLQIESFDSNDSFSRLENNNVDLVLTEKPAINDAVDFFPLMTDQFHLVVKSGHPLTVRNGALRDEFGKYACFLFKGPSQRRKQIEDFMVKHKIKLNILGEIENLETIKEMVKSTLALSFLPRWSVAKDLENHSLVALPYGSKVFERTWGFVYSRSRPLNLTGSTLLKLCRKRVTEAELKPQDTVKVGVLHSLSGTMAISETSLRDVLLFAFDEINHAGGIKVGGKSYKIDPVIVDGASNWPLFAQKAKELLVEDRVAVTFGCWTSVSRKFVQPVFEKENGLLFYPVQYEGEELSKSIFYIAETVNQQAIPAVDYLLAQGRKKFYLIGTDYVYPQTTNLILYKYLLLRGIPPEGIGGGIREDYSGNVVSAGKYVPFGDTDFHHIVADIKRFAASGDACVINTINGDSNVPFFKKIVAAGLKPADCPVVSFSLAEDELRSLPTKNLVGDLGCWSYFMSLKTPGNKTFLKNWYSWLKTESYAGVIKEKRALDSPIVLSYNGVYLWKKAVEKAGTFDVDAVRQVLESGEISFEGPGGKITVQANHHCTMNVYMGEIKANGQFKILQTFPQVVGEPFVGEPFLLKSLDETLLAMSETGG